MTSAKDLIKKLLVANQDHRLSSEEIKDHDWFAKFL